MNIFFSLIDESAARVIVRWRYEPPYDIYNLRDSAESIQYALDPQNHFYIMRDESGELVGFCSFGEDGQVPGGDYGAEALDIGMGIRPNLTGQGHGSNFGSAVLNFAERKSQPVAFRVTIAAFNQRARRVWEVNGFQQVQSFTHKNSKREFIVMVRDVNINKKNHESKSHV